MGHCCNTLILKDFIVMCDTSCNGIGGTLSQGNMEKDLPVVY